MDHIKRTVNIRSRICLRAIVVRCNYLFKTTNNGETKLFKGRQIEKTPLGEPASINSNTLSTYSAWLDTCFPHRHTNQYQCPEKRSYIFNDSMLLSHLPNLLWHHAMLLRFCPFFLQLFWNQIFCTPSSWCHHILHKMYFCITAVTFVLYLYIFYAHNLISKIRHLILCFIFWFFISGFM